MKPTYVLALAERNRLHEILAGVDEHPYRDYPAFSAAVAELIERGSVPAFFVDVAARIRAEREGGGPAIHLVGNCPIDEDLPELDHEDPVEDKHAKKTTFVGEALLELFAQLAGNPLLAYARNRRSFFTDVVAIKRYSGMLTGYSDSELFFHNDRTAHPVRADYTSLLGLRCPDDELIYTGYIDGRSLLVHLTEEEQRILRMRHFVTAFDVFSRDHNEDLTTSDPHPILENDHSFRYLDTMTTVAPDAPPEAKDALIALMNAVTRADRVRHRMRTRDLLVFANQDGLHSREKVEITDPDSARTRWLLKTYAFRDEKTAEGHADRWLDGVRGLVAD